MSLKKIGQILHAGPGNKAIAKVEVPPDLGATVFDIRKKPIGMVLDVFGPVSSPYIEVEVKGHDPKKVVNYQIFALPKSKHIKVKRKKK
ncbi:hypothetical protein KEJ34_02280 [Candidatus Bathyarchaeota archaeon]|nr:hypothetical protein [Candidatus Bathyarchaeota archaeon]